MKMSFRKPQFGPQDIAAILTAIFKCNGLEGPERCGSMEERTDTQRSGSPSRVCTVHFPEDVVQYARERSFRVDGPDGTITFYGKDVSRRVRAATEAAEDKRKANAAIGPCPTGRDQPFDALTVGAALHAAYEAGRTATIPSIAGNDRVLVVPYPTELVRLAWVAPRTRVSPPDVTSEEAFPSMTKAQKQRWIRKLKGFCAFLRETLTTAQATTPEVLAAEVERAKEREYAAAAAQAKAEKDWTDAKAAKATAEEQENNTPEVVAMEQDERSNAPEADEPI
jgi:hypothetical protein